MELILSLTAAGETHHRPLAAWAAGAPSPACRPGYMTHGGILTLSLHPIQDRPQQPQYPSAHHPAPGSQGEPVALPGSRISGGCPPLPPTGSTSPSEQLGLQTPTCTPCPRAEGLPHVQLGEASAQLEQCPPGGARPVQTPLTVAFHGGRPPCLSLRGSAMCVRSRSRVDRNPTGLCEASGINTYK